MPVPGGLKAGVHTDNDILPKGRRLYLIFFMALGAVMPFRVLYLERNGLTPTEIGLLGTVAAGVAILPSLLWVTWSDRVDKRRPFVLFGLACQTFIWLLYPLASRFGQFLMLMVSMSILVPPLEALMNVWILRNLDRGRLGAGYALVRIWGSLGWILATVAVGAAVQATDIRFAFVIGAGFLALTMLQPLRDEGEVKKVSERSGDEEFVGLHRVIPFAMATIMRAFSAGMIWTFLSIYLDRIGTPFWLIGWAWAVSAAPEIPIMIFAGRLSDRIGRVPLLIVGFACSSSMALAFVFIEAPWLALPFMSLSGVSYALIYISSVGYLADVAPRHRQATAQGLYVIVTTNLPRVAGPLLGGLMIDTYGLDSMFLLAGSLTLAAALVLIPSLRGESSRK